MNVRDTNDVRQPEMHTAESLRPEPRACENEIPIEKLKRYKAQGFNQIPAEIIQAGDKTLSSKIHELCNSIFKKELL
jgi:hypothetical protein